ncbi:MAG: phage major tail tube protein [Wohlfahrtiimonas sp.]
MSQISQIVNANIYVDGNSQIGRATEIDLGSITSKMNEINALGMLGTIEVFSGFEKMEGKISWNSFYPDVFRKVFNPMKNIKLMARANWQEVNSEGIGQELPLVTQIGASFKKNPLGVYKPKEATTFDSDIAIHSIVQFLGGKEIVAFDPVNNIYRVDGEDMVAKFRSNLGS